MDTQKQILQVHSVVGDRVTVPLDVDTMYMYPIVNFVITQVEIIAD